MARVLIDTSAWIEFYHPQGSPEVKRAVTEALERHEIAAVAPVVVELLSGAKTEKDYEALQADLEALSLLPLREEEALAAARLAWTLARAGQRVPTIDLLIAAAAQVHGYEIWHFGDGHFQTITSAGGPPQHDLSSA